MKQLFLMICLGIIMFASGNSLYAQDNDEKLSLSVDVASGFVWRGITYNTTPVVQPAITLTLGNFSIGAWGSSPFTSYEYQEFDIFASYQLTPSFAISITDYFFNEYGFQYSKPYFNFTKNNGNRAVDLQLIYEGSGGLKAMASTIIGGYDPNDEGKRNFSTYLELGYGNTTQSGFDWEIFAGLVPMKSETFYEIDGAAIINIGFGVSKSFEITPTYSLPLSLSFSVNPAYDAVFLVASISLF